MSHHYSGADFGFPHGDARLDFTDLYAFPKPGDAGKSILIMNAHPSAGANPPGPTTDVTLSPDAIYELKIDTNGDKRRRYRIPCARSRPRRMGRRPQRFAGLRERRLPGQVTTGRSSPRECCLDRAGDTGDGCRRPPLLHRLAQRSFFLRRGWRLEQPAIYRSRLLRGQGRVLHRAGSAQLCPQF